MDDLQDFVAEVRSGFSTLGDAITIWRMDPHQLANNDQIMAFAEATRLGAALIGMTRIERLAAAVEVAVADVATWGLEGQAAQTEVVISALERIDAIAAAVSNRMGLNSDGERSLASALSSEIESTFARSLMHTPQTAATVRVPLHKFRALVDAARAMHRFVAQLGDMPQPGQLAILRNDLARHMQTMADLPANSSARQLALEDATSPHRLSG